MERSKKRLWAVVCLVLGRCAGPPRWAAALLAAALALCAPRLAHALIGDVLSTHDLNASNATARGLAFDPATSRLYVLDGAAHPAIFVYQHTYNPATGTDSLAYLTYRYVPQTPGGVGFACARGLAYAVEDGHEVLYSLAFCNDATPPRSELWRLDITSGTSSFANLQQSAFDLGLKEPLGVTYIDGHVLVAYDQNGYSEYKKQVRRGILRMNVFHGNTASQRAQLWPAVQAGSASSVVKHMPTSGMIDYDEHRAVSYGLAYMVLGGRGYLFGTAGDDKIYAADAATGRGLFWFDRPSFDNPDDPAIWGLTFGNDALWVAARTAGPDRVLRVKVTTDLDVASEGARHVRHMHMAMTSSPDGSAPPSGRGTVKHNFSQPYTRPNQGFDAVSFLTGDDTGGGVMSDMDETFASDPGATQWVRQMKYTSTSSQHYTSFFEFDYWGRDRRSFVYPHRANTSFVGVYSPNNGSYAPNYTTDDADLYNMADAAAYASFVSRVQQYILDVYGEPADMTNPYWAARNVVEYMLEHYHYPTPDAGYDNPMNPSVGHYQSNPASWKLRLSDDADWIDNIVSCSPSSVMVVGVMRYLGFQARWIGAAHQASESAATPDDSTSTWDDNGDGFLSHGEAARGANGHRWAEVWLGNNYGWQRFDGTPFEPDDLDYAHAPKVRPQWDFMHRAAGPVEWYRMILNIGDGKKVSMWNDFEPATQTGGDQRYNMEARYSSPELWHAGETIQVTNACWFSSVATTPVHTGVYRVSWFAMGRWDMDPDATVELTLQKLNGDGDWVNNHVLAAGMAPGSPSGAFEFDVASAGTYRVRIRKEGDDQTGALTGTFVYSPP
jgi:hypothetical protein